MTNIEFGATYTNEITCGKKFQAGNWNSAHETHIWRSLKKTKQKQKLAHPFQGSFIEENNSQQKKSGLRTQQKSQNSTKVSELN